MCVTRCSKNRRVIDIREELAMEIGLMQSNVKEMLNGNDEVHISIAEYEAAWAGAKDTFVALGQNACDCVAKSVLSA